MAQPSNVAELPDQLFDYAKKAKLQFVDSPRIKDFLRYIDVFLLLGKKGIEVLVSYLSLENVLLDGLELLPLEDGSYGTISSEDLSKM